MLEALLHPPKQQRIRYRMKLMKLYIRHLRQRLLRAWWSVIELSVYTMLLFGTEDRYCNLLAGLPFETADQQW